MTSQFGDPRSHDRAPSHRKRAWPLASDVAARLAAGDTLGAIAREYGRTAATLRQRLNDHGYSAVTALPVPAETPPTGAGTFDAQPWADDALCAQVGGDTWVPDHLHGVAEARKVCAACPVAAPCLEYALQHEPRFGVYAGLTPNQRAKVKRAREAS